MVKPTIWTMNPTFLRLNVKSRLFVRLKLRGMIIAVLKQRQEEDSFPDPLPAGFGKQLEDYVFTSGWLSGKGPGV